MHVFVRLQYCKSTGLVMVSDVGMRHHRTMMTSSMVHQLVICWMLWMTLVTMIIRMEHSRLAIARKLGKRSHACTPLGQLKWLLLNRSSLPHTFYFSILTPVHNTNWVSAIPNSQHFGLLAWTCCSSLMSDADRLLFHTWKRQSPAMSTGKVRASPCDTWRHRLI